MKKLQNTLTCKTFDTSEQTLYLRSPTPATTTADLAFIFNVTSWLSNEKPISHLLQGHLKIFAIYVVSKQHSNDTSEDLVFRWQIVF